MGTSFIPNSFAVSAIRPKTAFRVGSLRFCILEVIARILPRADTRHRAQRNQL